MSEIISPENMVLCPFVSGNGLIMNCVKEKCAIYDKEKEKCAVLVIAQKERKNET